MISISLWGRNVSNALETFANIEFQKRIWIKGSGPEVSSFDEAFCVLFDDSFFADFLKLPEVTSNKKLLLSLKKTRDLLNEITDKEMSDVKINEKFLNSVRWNRVVNSALQAQKELDKACLIWKERTIGN